MLTYTRRHEGAVTSFTSWVGSNRWELLRVLRRHGPTFLSARELERRQASMLLNYARFLATRTPRMRAADFRSYHRGALGEMVRTIDPLEVARGLVLGVRHRVGSRARF